MVKNGEKWWKMVKNGGKWWKMVKNRWDFYVFFSPMG